MLGLGLGTGCRPQSLGGALSLPGRRSCAVRAMTTSCTTTLLRGSEDEEDQECVRWRKDRAAPWPLAKCCALLVVGNRLENIHFSWTLRSCLSHLHSSRVAKAPPLQSSSMGREMLKAAALPRRRKARFGSWMWLPLLCLFSFFRKSLLCGKTMIGAQPPAPRGGARVESGAAAGRCRCFIRTQLDDWKTKIPFFASLEIFFSTNWKQLSEVVVVLFSPEICYLSSTFFFHLKKILTWSHERKMQLHRDQN